LITTVIYSTLLAQFELYCDDPLKKGKNAQSYLIFFHMH